MCCDRSHCAPRCIILFVKIHNSGKNYCGGIRITPQRTYNSQDKSQHRATASQRMKTGAAMAKPQFEFEFEFWNQGVRREGLLIVLHCDVPIRLIFRLFSAYSLFLPQFSLYFLFIKDNKLYFRPFYFNLLDFSFLNPWDFRSSKVDFTGSLGISSSSLCLWKIDGWVMNLRLHSILIRVLESVSCLLYVDWVLLWLMQVGYEIWVICWRFCLQFASLFVRSC